MQRSIGLPVVFLVAKIIRTFSLLPANHEPPSSFSLIPTLWKLCPTCFTRLFADVETQSRFLPEFNIVEELFVRIHSLSIVPCASPHAVRTLCAKG